MTAQELLPKQDRQLRIERVAQAERRANRRDFDIKYGGQKRGPHMYETAKRRPYGVVTLKRRKQHVNWHDELIVVGLCLIIGFVLVLIG